MRKEKQIKLENLLAEFKKDYIDPAKSPDLVNLNEFLKKRKEELKRFTYLELSKFNPQKYFSKLNWEGQKNEKEIIWTLSLLGELKYDLLNPPFHTQYPSNRSPAPLEAFKYKSFHDIKPHKNHVYFSQLHL